MHILCLYETFPCCLPCWHRGASANAKCRERLYIIFCLTTPGPSAAWFYSDNDLAAVRIGQGLSSEAHALAQYTHALAQYTHLKCKFRIWWPPLATGGFYWPGASWERRKPTFNYSIKVDAAVIAARGMIKVGGATFARLLAAATPTPLFVSLFCRALISA